MNRDAPCPLLFSGVVQPPLCGTNCSAILRHAALVLQPALLPNLLSFHCTPLPFHLPTSECLLASYISTPPECLSCASTPERRVLLPTALFHLPSSALLCYLCSNGCCCAAVPRDSTSPLSLAGWPRPSIDHFVRPCGALKAACHFQFIRLCKALRLNTVDGQPVAAGRVGGGQAVGAMPCGAGGVHGGTYRQHQTALAGKGPGTGWRQL